ncbi:MAG: VCBS domain-containing protein [Halobacteriota archaeon]
MRKRILTLALCAVMVSTIAATTAVSAAPFGNSNIRQFDVVSCSHHDRMIGKLIVDYTDGSFSYTSNTQKSDTKDLAKGFAGTTVTIVAVNTLGQQITLELASGEEFTIVQNGGGNDNAEGTFSQSTLDWLAQWGVPADGSTPALIYAAIE